MIEAIAPQRERTREDMVFEKRPIVIVAAARSGTHLLRSSMHGNSEIFDAGEFLNPNLNKINPASFFLRMAEFHKKHLPEELLDQEIKRKSFGVYFSKLADDYPGQRILFDLKLNQIQHVDTLFRYANAPPFILKFLAEQGAAFILLKRRNILKQFCSQKIAIESDAWVDWQHNPAGERDGGLITIDVRHLVSELEDLRLRMQIAERWVRGIQRKITLAYEDLLEDGKLSPTIADQIIRLTGETWTIPGVPRTRKQGQPLAETIKNYDEVRRTLAGTAFESFLDDEAPAAPSRQGAAGHRSPSDAIGRPLLVIADSDDARASLCASIAAMPGFVAYGRVFDQDASSEPQVRFASFLNRQMAESPTPQLGAATASELLQRYFQCLAERADNRAYLVDMHPDSLRQLDWPPHPVAAPPAIVSFVRSRGIPVIHLAQRDLVAAAAERTLLESGQATEGLPARLDSAAFRRNWNLIAAARQVLRIWFGDHRPFAFLAIEDLSAHDRSPKFVGTRLAAQTGLPLERLDTRLALAPQRIDARIANYRDLRELVPPQAMGWDPGAG